MEIPDEYSERAKLQKLLHEVQEQHEFKTEMRALVKQLRRFEEAGRVYSEEGLQLVSLLKKISSLKSVVATPLDSLTASVSSTFQTLFENQNVMLSKLESGATIEANVPSVYDFIEVESVRRKLEKSANEAMKSKNKGVEFATMSVHQKSLEVALAEVAKKSTNKLSDCLSVIISSHNDLYKQSSSMFTNLKLSLDDSYLKMQRPQSGIVREGLVSRKTRTGGWSKTYIVIRETTFVAYDEKQNFKPKNEFKTALIQVKSVDREKGIFEIVTILKKNPIILQVQNATEHDSWMKAFQQAIAASLEMGTNKQGNKAYKPSYATIKLNDSITTLIKLAGNDLCADCGQSLPEWASINLGVLICMDCSGVHRNLGVHISKIRSLTLDRWEHDLLAFLLKIGNAKANAIFEHKVEGLKKPTAESPPDEREAFIRAKYETKRFIAPKPTIDINKEFWNLASQSDDVVAGFSLLVFGADVNWSNPEQNGETPLHVACKNNNQRFIPFLIQQRADISAKENQNGSTPVHVAVSIRNTAILEMLLKANAAAAAVMDKSGRNALQLALESDAPECVNVLQEYMGDVRSIDWSHQDELPTTRPRRGTDFAAPGSGRSSPIKEFSNGSSPISSPKPIRASPPSSPGGHVKRSSVDSFQLEGPQTTANPGRRAMTVSSVTADELLKSTILQIQTAEQRLTVFSNFASNYPELLARDNMAIVGMSNSMNQSLKELETFATEQRLTVPPKELQPLPSASSSNKTTLLSMLAISSMQRIIQILKVLQKEIPSIKDQARLQLFSLKIAEVIKKHFTA